MRDRVFGIETEYAVIYHPSRTERVEERRPTNYEIFQLFESRVAARHAGMPRAFSLLRSKSGRFLANGMSFHYEATPKDFEHGLVEMASPACRDPFSLVAHERAKDALVEELCEGVNRSLNGQGYEGEVRIGKNNVDTTGHTFGSHENYWIEDRLSRERRLVLVPVFLGLWLVTLPVIAWLVLVNGALILGGLLVAAAPLLGGLLRLMARPVGRASRSASLQLHRASRTLAAAPVRLAAILARDPGALMRRLAWVELPFLPVVALHSFVYNRFHYTSARRSLPAFLVTRTLYTGAGRVVPGETPLLRTAQRPEFLRSLARMFTSGDKRPLIETRDLFFRPWSAFTSRRRLHLLGADANLADHALVLRAGATALVLEALETDPEWRWPRLKDPLAAFREVARDPAMSARLPLVGEPAATALAIQRRYLEGAREVLAPALAELPPDHWKTRVLAMWEETLDALEEHPESLADRVDWIAKAALLHREVPDPAARAALERPEADVLRRPRGGDPVLRAAAFRALRLDLRYHELGPRGGHRRLLETGRMRSLVSDDAVRRARLEPPPDTRAAARGRAIRDAARGAGGATWHRVRVGRTEWRFLPDPLSPEPGFVLRLPEAWAPGKSGG
jgi:hypothetical protein